MWQHRCRILRTECDQIHNLGRQTVSCHLPDISIDADGPFPDIVRAECLTEIYACVDGIRIVCSHLPERILDDTGSIITYAKLQIQYLSVMAVQKIMITLRRLMPAFIFYKLIIRPQLLQEFSYLYTLAAQTKVFLSDIVSSPPVSYHHLLIL